MWLEDTPVAVLVPPGMAVSHGGASAGSVAAFYVETDALETPRAIVNVAHQTVWSWDSAPFGDTAANENPGGQGVFRYSLRLPGQQFDLETQSHYNYFRDYEPATGRYFQADPMGQAGGLGLYSYVDANPLQDADPLGLVKLSLNFGDGWSRAERNAARRKVKDLDCFCKSGKAKKTKPTRAPGSASSRYRAGGGSVPADYDVDHIIDLQMGGCDCLSNMRPLQRRVNRSLGAQIAARLRGLPYGTKITGVCIL